MYYPKRWRDRAHSLTRVGFQYLIGAGNEYLGGEEGGIKGTPVGMRTVVGVTGALTAAMGSDLGADAMYAALGSGAELAGKKTIEYWRGKKTEPVTQVAEQSQAQPQAQPQTQQAPAPQQVVTAPQLVAVPAGDVLDALGPELRKEVEAVIERRVKARTRKVAKKVERETLVEQVAHTTAAAGARTG